MLYKNASNTLHHTYDVTKSRQCKHEILCFQNFMTNNFTRHHVAMALKFHLKFANLISFKYQYS